MPYDVSGRALRPLLQTFWSSHGWRQPPELPDGPVLEGAINAGLMFRESTQLDHDGWVARARSAVARVSATDVGLAFLVSLETRRLDLRSALGSYAVARHLPLHSFEPATDGGGCRVCGLSAQKNQDLNVLNFERFKWGGVRREDITFVAFDLEQFAKAPGEALTDEGLAAGRELVKTLRSAPPRATATNVATQIRSFGSNKAEREVVMDILGVCGVLREEEHPSFRREFIHSDSRPLPNQHFIDRAYPACWWRGSGGVDDDALGEFLPQLA
jgi:hypothetical protein